MAITDFLVIYLNMARLPSLFARSCLHTLTPRNFIRFDRQKYRIGYCFAGDLRSDHQHPIAYPVISGYLIAFSVIYCVVELEIF